MDADVEGRFKRIDRRLHGITTLIRMGAKVLVRTAQQQAEMKRSQVEMKQSQAEINRNLAEISRLQKEDRQAIHALIESQMRAEARMDRWDARMDRLQEQSRSTDQKLDRLIAALLKNQRNGR